jgi:hypothetical protein
MSVSPYQLKVCFLYDLGHYINYEVVFHHSDTSKGTASLTDKGRLINVNSDTPIGTASCSK